MKETIWMGNERVGVITCGALVINMSGSGLQGSCMAMAASHGRQVDFLIRLLISYPNKLTYHVNGVGDVYRGTWEMGKATGNGLKVTIDGTNIEGIFIDGLAHGWTRKVCLYVTISSYV